MMYFSLSVISGTSSTRNSKAWKLIFDNASNSSVLAG